MGEACLSARAGGGGKIAIFVPNHLHSLTRAAFFKSMFRTREVISAKSSMGAVNA